MDNPPVAGGAAPAGSEARVTLRRMLAGFQVSQAIHVAATLGIADLLAAGPRASDELAGATGTHGDTLYRLLRALASVGVLRELDGRRFALAPLGDVLRTEVPGSMADLAVYVGRPYRLQAWGGLLHSVHTGENSFRHVHGKDAWSWRAQRPAEQEIFNRAMSALSRNASVDVLAAFDFSRCRQVVDVGGGHGALLAALLAAHPRLQGVLFDQPDVVSCAAALLQGAGVADRCTVVGGNFFDSIPEGGDVYVLRAILHDWDDADCARILACIAKAMAPGGRVLVIEQLIAAPNDGPDAKFSDLAMLVGPGGQERTREEFASLFADSGLKLQRVKSAGEQFIMAGAVADDA
jgi:hypothetical protein